MVVTEKFNEGEVALNQSNNSDNHVRYFIGKGRSHEQSDSSGSMVQQNESTAHKQFRARSYFSDIQTFFELIGKQKCPNSVRQHDSSPMFKQANGTRSPQLFQMTLEP